MKSISLVNRINFALSTIVLLSISTMLVSYWLSDQADNDAYVINQAGSLRMYSYQYAAYAATQPEKADALKNKIDEVWHDPTLMAVSRHPRINDCYQQALVSWQALGLAIAERPYVDIITAPVFAEHIANLQHYVHSLQLSAEGKIQTLRTAQVIAFFITTLLAVVILHWVRIRVNRPLKELTQTAQQISIGNFQCNLSHPQRDEFGLLAETFNSMCRAISEMYDTLEQQVDDKTQALTHSNITLTFLYTLAKKISAHEAKTHDFTQVMRELSQIIGIDDIELCLVTTNGDIPYLQISGSDTHPECTRTHCHECLDTDSTNGACPEAQINFALQRENKRYGIIAVRPAASTTLQTWQQQLIRAVADQLAIALSLRGEEEQVRRITLMKERNVIARELHDSLAQALSYLKIQVSRLNKALATDNKPLIHDVADELKQGLDSAYRQLRELLTTFRLKIDGNGLLSALQKTVQQFTQESTMIIQLDYRLINIPLSPSEEIHLLQIVREACQNAIRHSQGQHLVIQLDQHDDGRVALSVEDDGIGVDEHPDRTHHYGMEIMRERSQQLQGELSVKRRNQGGTGIYAIFTPEYLRSK
ncbi:MAG: HAMP domain-containing protein [Bacterioplanes sp.]|nr:HAMP domain-containing protein [Bacterioplanes sp.]